ncbi:dolichyldiphosphatase [Diutina catenulata]
MEAVPFDHTYILYDPTDVVSMACVHLSLLPVYIMVFYTSWFLITREIEPVIVVGGHLGSEVVNKIVKHIIRQPRPDFHKDFGKGSYGSSYGMPSAHSQFAGFFAAYFLCVVLTKVPVSTLSKVVVSAGLLTVGFLVPFSRVYLMYHTWPQVAVGVMLGVALGLVYFVVASFARQFGVVDWVLRWPIVRWFSVKDGYHHNYQSFEQEFQAVEAAKAKKAAKKAL